MREKRPLTIDLVSQLDNTVVLPLYDDERVWQTNTESVLNADCTRVNTPSWFGTEGNDDR
jgi:hypothetical protein